MLAAVELPASLYPDTDFASAFVNVSVNHAVTSDECAQFAFPQVSTDAASAAQAKVGALEFNEIESINGETPKQADAKYYHISRTEPATNSLWVSAPREMKRTAQPRLIARRSSAG